MTRADWRVRLRPVTGGEVEYQTWHSATNDGVRSRMGYVVMLFAVSVDQPEHPFHVARLPFSLS